MVKEIERSQKLVQKILPVLYKTGCIKASDISTKCVANVLPR
jgi:hypothetical protein